ncbi:endonuclease III [Candidatus Woesearchaeota archaeon]|nr:endonuclease III [Candidatus Woesearchaeota archaeon]
MESLKEKSKRAEKIVEILKKLKGMPYLSVHKKDSPFRILIGTILSQRNRDIMTEKASKKLFSKFDNVEKMANASLKEIEKLIKQSGFYKTKAKYIKKTSRIILEKYNGKVPKDMDKLLELPGVGRKTANCVLVYAYRKDAIPVDTHVHRISNRLKLVNTKKPEETEKELLKIVPKKYWQVFNELLVNHGQTVCKPIKPECYNCKIVDYCKFKNKNL